MYTREQAEQVLNDYHNSGIVAFEKFLDAKFPRLKDGMWVKTKYPEYKRIFVYIEDLKDDCIIGYGFNQAGEWSPRGTTWFIRCIEHATPATDKEVIEALEKYANFIGLVEGARVKCLATGCIERVNIGHFTSGYDLRVGNFYLRAGVGAILVMKNGEWATPIKSDLHEKLEELKKQAEAEGMKLVITFENK